VQVATASGFRSADVMRRAFLRALGTTPLRYRRHVRTPAATAVIRRATSRGPLAAARREIARAARAGMTSNPSFNAALLTVAGRRHAGSPGERPTKVG
jgi:methylphosphotriester-DNA--protein-cysteine methyltransferase